MNPHIHTAPLIIWHSYTATCEDIFVFLRKLSYKGVPYFLLFSAVTDDIIVLVWQVQVFLIETTLQLPY